MVNEMAEKQNKKKGLEKTTVTAIFAVIAKKCGIHVKINV